MIKVLALTGPIRESVLLDAIEQIVARKVELSVMCDFDATEYAIPDEHVEVRSLPAAIQSGEVSIRRRPRATSPSYRRWIRFHADPWFRAKSRHANLIVALDQGSVHAVWELAQRHRRPQAIYGLAPALALLDKFLGEPLPAGASVVGHVPVVGRRVVRRTRREAIATLRRAARLAVSPTVMRSRVGVSAWTALASAPGIPPNVRTKIAYRAHVNMMAAGRPQQALAATDAALVHLGKPEQRATLLAREAASEIAAGVTPSLPRALHVQLELADAAHAAGHHHKAADALDAARRLLFHRMLHLDRMSSPLIDDPDAFMEPWRRSTAAMALAAPRGRSAPAAASPTDRPMHLLLATNGNPSFLTEIRQLFEANPAVNVRVIDLAEDGRRSRLTRSIKQMMEHALAGTTAYGHRVDEWLTPHLEWADTVFVDGCVATAAMFSMIDPGSTRVIVRWHGFEAFSIWPHLVDFDRVDDLVFVSEHVRDLGVALLPQLATARTRVSVIDNAMELTRYAHPKSSDARFTLGVVGIGSVAKDPRWAIEVVQELRRTDERYQLVLVGAEPDTKMSRAAREYFELLTAELADAEATGAVALAGHVDDVPAALTQIGVILSSSLQESLHCSLVEGAASGAIPVVRDWPYFAGRRNSARTLFPSDWVVDTPQQAAARILELTQREDVWRAAGAAAATTAIQTWDWQVVSRKFEELIPTVSTSGAVDAIVEGSADLDPESDAASATSNVGR
jgi:glycosyltransferase involved in cell wall biosynthesis